MKKLFALILTVAMLFSLSVAAFAAEINQGTAESNGSTSVYFEVAPTYTITIPATVELAKTENAGVVTYENDYTITASENLRLKKHEYVEVTIATDGVMTTDEGATLDYTVSVGGSAVANGDVVAAFGTNTAEQTSTMHIAANDPTYAGRYEDIVTFTIAVKSGRQ